MILLGGWNSLMQVGMRSDTETFGISSGYSSSCTYLRSLRWCCGGVVSSLVLINLHWS